MMENEKRICKALRIETHHVNWSGLSFTCSCSTAMKPLCSGDWKCWLSLVILTEFFCHVDASNIMESKRHDGRLGSDSSTPGKFETRISSKTLHVGESSSNFKFYSLPKEPLATQREDPTSGKQPAKQKATQEYVVNGKGSRVILDRKAPEDHHEQHINSKSHLIVNKIMYETTHLSSVTGKEVSINEIISIPVRYHSGEGVNGLGFAEKNYTAIHLLINRFRRSAAPQTSTGSLSPGADFNSANKRPALVCDFFARGWCIKGSSCRFIHIKDSVNNPKQQPKEDVAAADGKKAVQLDEGFRNGAERSKSFGSTDTLPSSVGNKIALSSHFFSERILPLGHDENQRLHPFHEISKFLLLQSKDKSMGTSPVSQRFSASTDDLGPSKYARQNSTGQNLPADNYAKPASLNDRGSSTFRNSFLPDSLSACSLVAQKVLDNERECRTSRLSSLLQGSSPFSSSEPENFPVNDIARDPLHFAEYRIKISSDDWEPSVPFRPSFFVTSGMSSPQSQYDPLCDSIDLSNDGERSLKFSFSSQGPSLLNVAYPPTDGDSTSTGPLVPECNDDKKTASCHNGYLENLANNNCYTSGKDSLTTDANDGTSAADMQNGTLAKEEISSVSLHVKDISKTNKIDTDCDGRHQRDGSRLKVDRVREKNEIYDEHKADGDALKESKAMRHFFAALVDLIKELLKPTWREGHLSKDAHNTIVKKAVDKVLGTIQPHQTPITFESVKQYLSSSQPKIARLVEAYIDKYGKS
ncbi:hypothetical protein CRYUN_Cryun31cG0031900 [Craigia yunnanensis]